MPRPRSPDREKAKEIYLNSNGEIPLTDIAAQLDVLDTQIRKWKSLDKWDESLKGNVTNQKGTSKGKITKQRGKISTKLITTNNPEEILEKSPNGANSRTNSPSPFARFGNQNAKGNKGGPGGPKENGHAITTMEFARIYYNDLDDDERALLEHETAFTDKYFLQLNIIKDYTLRELKIRKKIRELENTPGGMVFETVTKEKGSSVLAYTNRNKDGKEWAGTTTTQTTDNTSHVAQPVLEKVIKLEEVLTRIQGKKQKAIETFHRMRQDDVRLAVEIQKQILKMQVLTGRIDIAELVACDDLELYLDELMPEE